jgi:DNA repair exonuclease SbcCD ATPase subunit
MRLFKLLFISIISVICSSSVFTTEVYQTSNNQKTRARSLVQSPLRKTLLFSSGSAFAGGVCGIFFTKHKNQKEMDKIKENMSKASNAAIETHKKQVSEQEENLKNAKDTIVTMAEQMKVLKLDEKQSIEKDKKIKELTQQLESQQKPKQDMETSTDDTYSSNMNSIQSKMEEELQSLRDELKAKREECEELQSQLANKQRDCEQLENQLKEQEIREEAVEGSEDSLKLQEQITDLKNNLDLITGQLNREQLITKDLQKKWESTQKQLEILRGQLASKEEECEQLQKKLKEEPISQEAGEELAIPLTESQEQKKKEIPQEEPADIPLTESQEQTQDLKEIHEGPLEGSEVQLNILNSETIKECIATSKKMIDEIQTTRSGQFKIDDNDLSQKTFMAIFNRSKLFTDDLPKLQKIQEKMESIPSELQNKKIENMTELEMEDFKKETLDLFNLLPINGTSVADVESFDYNHRLRKGIEYVAQSYEQAKQFVLTVARITNVQLLRKTLKLPEKFFSDQFYLSIKRDIEDKISIGVDFFEKRKDKKYIDFYAVDDREYTEKDTFKDKDIPYSIIYQFNHLSIGKDSSGLKDKLTKGLETKKEKINECITNFYKEKDESLEKELNKKNSDIKRENDKLNRSKSLNEKKRQEEPVNIQDIQTHEKKIKELEKTIEQLEKEKVLILKEIEDLKKPLKEKPYGKLVEKIFQVITSECINNLDNDQELIEEFFVNHNIHTFSIKEFIDHIYKKKKNIDNGFDLILYTGMKPEDVIEKLTEQLSSKDNFQEDFFYDLNHNGLAKNLQSIRYKDDGDIKYFYTKNDFMKDNEWASSQIRSYSYSNKKNMKQWFDGEIPDVILVFQHMDSELTNGPLHCLDHRIYCSFKTCYSKKCFEISNNQKEYYDNGNFCQLHENLKAELPHQFSIFKDSQEIQDFLGVLNSYQSRGKCCQLSQCGIKDLAKAIPNHPVEIVKDVI